METTVIARLETSKRFAIDKTFPFYDLPVLLESLCPNKIEVCFHKCAKQGSVIYLALTFPEKSSIDSISLFKETLLRSEIELDIDCVFYNEAVSQFEESMWLSVEIQPEVMALPSGKQIAVSISLLEAATELFRQAAFTDTDLCYRLKLELTEPDLTSAKELVPALAELQSKYTMPGLEDAVRSSFDLLRSGGWLCQEQICITRNTAISNRSRIENIMRTQLKSQISFIPDTFLIFQWSDVANDISNILQKKVAQLRNSGYLKQLFHQILPSVRNISVIIKSLENARSVYKNSYTQGNYAFISYSHTNIDFVRLLLQQLDIERVRYWYDTSISVGSLWDESLEEKICSAGVFIACVSDEYQISKYCKRELKFADLINKKILPIAPLKWQWGIGLQMMFQELQVLNFDETHDIKDLCRTLQVVAPQVFIS
jgi:hypothetical protein